MELFLALLPGQATTSTIWLFAIHHYGMGEISSNRDNPDFPCLLPITLNVYHYLY